MKVWSFVDTACPNLSSLAITIGYSSCYPRTATAITHNCAKCYWSGHDSFTNIASGECYFDTYSCLYLMD